MIIRFLNEKDISEFNKVSSSAFIWKVDPNADNKLPETAAVIGAFADDGKTLMAITECNDFKNYFGRGLLNCVGVGGVATKPEFRRMGGVRRLFSEVERLSVEKDWDIGILHPFSTAYYRLFGYETAGLYVRAKAPFSCFSHIERNCSVDLLEEGKLGDVLTLYDKIAKKTNLCFCRETGVYFNLKPYETTNYTYMWKNDAGEYRAYASYSVSRQESTVNVSEIGFLDSESLHGIIGFLRCYDGNQDYISFGKLPLDSPVFDIIPETSKVERHLGNIGSVRIYNIEKVLKTRIYPEESGHFSLLAEDCHKPNAGVYEVEFSKGKAEIKKRPDGNADISLTPAAASRLLTSGVTGGFDALRYRSGVKVFNENNDLLKAFPFERAFFTEGF